MFTSIELCLRHVFNSYFKALFSQMEIDSEDSSLSDALVLEDGMLSAPVRGTQSTDQTGLAGM